MCRLIQNNFNFDLFRITYKLKVVYFHQNSWLEPNHMDDDLDKSFGLYFFYDSLLIEDRIEDLVYDVGSFLTSLGGYLGLLLGFSCLSVSFACIRIIRKYANLRWIVHFDLLVKDTTQNVLYVIAPCICCILYLSTLIELCLLILIA